MKTFDELWNDLKERSQRWAIPIVQDYHELEHVFNLMKGCESYLEIGSAEGNTLLTLGQALGATKESERYISYVDFGEKHTTPARDEAIERLEAIDVLAGGLHGNSHSREIIPVIGWNGRSGPRTYDAVFIDAGHSYEDVIADAIAYGHLATKYIFFHDIQLPEVRKAYEWYLAQNPELKHYEFINSPNYGYGIITL